MSKDLNITLKFAESEIKWIETLMDKYYGKKKRNKKELKSALGRFVSTMFSKGSQAVEYDEEYINMKL